MAWNEKGGGNNPWNNGGQQGPPDLDKVVRDLQNKLGGVFGLSLIHISEPTRLRLKSRLPSSA